VLGDAGRTISMHCNCVNDWGGEGARNFIALEELVSRKRRVLSMVCTRKTAIG